MAIILPFSRNVYLAFSLGFFPYILYRKQLEKVKKAVLSYKKGTKWKSDKLKKTFNPELYKKRATSRGPEGPSPS